MKTKGQGFKVVGLSIGVVAALLLSSTPANARSVTRVDDYRPGKHRVEMIKHGKLVKRAVAPTARVVLRATDGTTTRADINELVPGARVLGIKDRNSDGRIDRIVLREQPSGSADCSFEDDGDESDSWDCKNHHDGDDEDILEQCSYDSSADSDGDATEGDSSSDESWSCSYESEDDDDGNGLEWDCSYDASESSSWGPSGRSIDGDASFDCSWESDEKLDRPLWHCKISRSPMGWLCHSTLLDQTFGTSLTSPAQGFETFLDFNDDYESGSPGPAADCDNNGGGSFNCSFDIEGEVGGCEFDLSFDRSFDGHEGDVSGDISFSCESDSDSDE